MSILEKKFIVLFPNLLGNPGTMFGGGRGDLRNNACTSLKSCSYANSLWS